jgi:hypothetical protein
VYSAALARQNLPVAPGPDANALTIRASLTVQAIVLPIPFVDRAFRGPQLMDVR